MSWQAQTAVNHHSKINDMKLFRLLLYLAEGADDNGRVDPAPSQDTLAEFYGVTPRTIRAWLTKLCDSGELEQTRVGSGPGNPSAYQVTLPMPDKGGKKVEENPGSLSTFESFMVEIKAEIDALKVEISSLKVEKVEAQGGKGGSERRKAHSSKSADDPGYDPSFDPKGEKENPFPFKPAPKGDKPEHKGPADKRLDAILAVCGLNRDIPSHLVQAENVSAQLKSYSAGSILDRYQFTESPNGGWYWYRDDWRGHKGQQPTPENIIETIGKRKFDGHSTNGRAPSIPKPAPAEERIPGAQ